MDLEEQLLQHAAEEEPLDILYPNLNLEGEQIQQFRGYNYYLYKYAKGFDFSNYTEQETGGRLTLQQFDEMERRITYYSSSAVRGDKYAQCLSCLGCICLILSLILYYAYKPYFETNWKWKLLDFTLISCIFWNTSLCFIYFVSKKIPFYYEIMDERMRKYFNRVNNDSLHAKNIKLEYIAPRKLMSKRIIKLNKFFDIPLALPNEL